MIEVHKEITKLESIKDKCLKYRQLPIDKILEFVQDESSAVAPPSIYPNQGDEEQSLNGFCGCGCVSIPFINSNGYESEYHYDGFLVNGQACLHGKLLRNNNLVSEGLARDLLSICQIQSHVFDPNFLKSKIMTSNSHDFDATYGDLFIPDDMHDRFIDSHGKFLKPSFKNKRMVLMGPMGVGKTSLFNRLTGSNTTASDMLQTCTKTNSISNGLGPASDLVANDTSGTAVSVINGMTVDQAFQLRKAITTGEVSQIVVTISAPNNARAQAYCDQLDPLKEFFDCNTFRQDINGTDVVMNGNKSSPHRTRPFVVITHRDMVPLSARRNFLDIIKKI